RTPRRATLLHSPEHAPIWCAMRRFPAEKCGAGGSKPGTHVANSPVKHIAHLKEKHMKLVVAISKPFKLDEGREALSDIGTQGMTVMEVKGFGRQKGHTGLYRGAEYAVDFLPKLRLELALSDELVAQAVEALCSAAHTG